MPSAAGGVIDQSVGHSAFRILPTVPQPTSQDFIPQITFRIPHFRKLTTPGLLITMVYYISYSAFAIIAKLDRKPAIVMNRSRDVHSSQK